MIKMTQIDARGLACPKPVIETKKMIDKMTEGSITTIVDNEIAVQNVSKLAQSMSCNVDVKQVEKDFYINIYRGELATPLEVETTVTGDLVILVGKDTLGQGEGTLGKTLMKGYMYTLTEYAPYPKAILFLNSGVNLTTKGSEVIKYLRHLEENGVEILSCGACLDYYKVKDKLEVGGVTNMYTIVDTLHSAKKQITL